MAMAAKGAKSSQWMKGHAGFQWANEIRFDSGCWYELVTNIYSATHNYHVFAAMIEEKSRNADSLFDSLVMFTNGSIGGRWYKSTKIIAMIVYQLGHQPASLYSPWSCSGDPWFLAGDHFLANLNRSVPWTQNLGHGGTGIPPCLVGKDPVVEGRARLIPIAVICSSTNG